MKIHYKKQSGKEGTIDDVGEALTIDIEDGCFTLIQILESSEYNTIEGITELKILK